LGTGDGVSPVSLHPAVNANTIPRINPAHDLDADVDKNCTLHPLHSGDALIPIFTSVRLNSGSSAGILAA
jgi:hypothetical protein